MRISPALFLLAALLAAPVALVAQEGRAPTGKPLLEIVVRLEREGYGPFTELSFKRGQWDVEAYKDGRPYELRIDAATGRTVAQNRDQGDAKPPANAKRLSEILKTLEAQGYARIHDVAFERSSWEVEAYRDGSRRELRVDPVTGEVVSDRADD